MESSICRLKPRLLRRATWWSGHRERVHRNGEVSRIGEVSETSPFDSPVSRCPTLICDYSACENSGGGCCDWSWNLNWNWNWNSI